MTKYKLVSAKKIPKRRSRSFAPKYFEVVSSLNGFEGDGSNGDNGVKGVMDLFFLEARGGR